MNSSKVMNIGKTIAPIMLGTAVYAFGLLYFIVPNQLMEGGVTGITILLNYAFSIPIFLTTLLLEPPAVPAGLESTRLESDRLYRTRHRVPDFLPLGIRTGN